MSVTQPIGVFDSGVGGLSILKGINNLLPNEDLLYVGDIKYSPYGDKSIDFIEQRAVDICEFLIAKGVKAIIVACNTATVSVVQRLRTLYTLPIIGVEPAVKPAAISSRSGQVGVLSTERTLTSTNFKALIAKHGKQVNFTVVACHGLVEQIERLQLESDKTRDLLDHYLQPLLGKNIDVLVLGCTHYPFIKPLLKQMLPANIIILDTAEPVAKEVKRRLMTAGVLNNQQQPGQVNFYSSGCSSNASKVISNLWGKPISVQLMAKIN